MCYAFKITSCTLQNARIADSVNVGPQGKWMYEVTLGTAGIMQLGWATAGCQFSNEEGVGDSVDSYAYDGKRVQRWNISCKLLGSTPPRAHMGWPFSPTAIMSQGMLPFVSSAR